MHLELSRQNHLQNPVIILDGLTGSGKTLLMNVLAELNGAQAPRFDYQFEQIIIVTALGKMEVETAKCLLTLAVDQSVYDYEIAREVNLRPFDLSCVLGRNRTFKVIKRLLSSDSAPVKERIAGANLIPIFVTHQCSIGLRVLENVFGDRLRHIDLMRHPISLVEHWTSYYENHGISPFDFTIGYKQRDSDRPWFEYLWGIKDPSLTLFHDRAVASIVALMKQSLTTQESDTNKKIYFEKFVREPHIIRTEIESFVGEPFHDRVDVVLRKEGVPRKNPDIGVNRSIYRRYAYDHNKAKQLGQPRYMNAEYRKVCFEKIQDLALRRTFRELCDEYEDLAGIE
jgi:hypothetical protein